jgi:predicted dehydrogenase
MAHYHYRCFQKTQRADLVAIADIREDNARLFLDRYESKARHYLDYREMLRQEQPDIVSICTWPHLHAEMCVAACEAGVKAIHCEKPMATTWGDAKRMKAAADASGTILTFNHQRRFFQPFQEIKRLVKDGAIGELQRIEGQCGNMYDWGTHWLDMFFFYNDETPAEWVIGQIDSRKENRVFGARMENQAVCHWKWRNGVRGLLVTGHEADMQTEHRLMGTEGVIELSPDGKVRYRGKDAADWRNLELTEGIHGELAIERACADLARALDEPGYTPLLAASHAIQSTELIFATYYSSRIRGRVDLPLTYDGNAFLDMLEKGEIGPDRRAKTVE